MVITGALRQMQRITSKKHGPQDMEAAVVTMMEKVTGRLQTQEMGLSGISASVRVSPTEPMVSSQMMAKQIFHHSKATSVLISRVGMKASEIPQDLINGEENLIPLLPRMHCRNSTRSGLLMIIRRV